MLRVEAVMNRHVEYASGEESVMDLAAMMGDLDVGALPLGSETAIEGIVTDRDVLYRVVARGLDPRAVKARDIASYPVVACRPGDSLQAAMDLMAAHRVRRLAVRAEDGPVVGWITLADLSRMLLVESGTVQSALRDLTTESAG